MSPFRFKLGALALLAVATIAAAGDPSSARAQKERAAAALEAAVKADPQNAELWVHIGFAYRKMDDIDRSRQAFEKAAALDPKNKESLYMLGLIYENEKRNQDALRVWKQYLPLATDPEKRDVAENHIHHLSQ